MSVVLDIILLLVLLGGVLEGLQIGAMRAALRGVAWLVGMLVARAVVGVVTGFTTSGVAIFVAFGVAYAIANGIAQAAIRPPLAEPEEEAAGEGKRKPSGAAGAVDTWGPFSVIGLRSGAYVVLDLPDRLIGAAVSVIFAGLGNGVFVLLLRALDWPWLTGIVDGSALAPSFVRLAQSVSFLLPPELHLW